MDCSTSLLSPRSSSSSPFSFSPLNSPSTLSAPSSSCCGSPSSSSSSFSFSPLPSPRPISTSASSTLRPSAGFPDLDSSASPFWGSAKPFSTSLQPPPAARSRPPAINVTNYATTTEASPRLWAPSTQRSHYALLGVSPAASPQEIRVAYRKLALQHHPDVSPLHQLDQSTKLFAEINEAYTTLSDPQKKACYDLKLALDSPGIGMSSPLHHQSSPSPRKYTDMSTGRVYPSMNSFYREWRRGQS